ncbi:hypothetical protein [Bradyrhizobium sp. JYMT SZCCT0180]|uniref:hypothetical protein n=1 Tax=Bradyrhizobium sp. JYMT SZCCT0180 TaxID=2807666 RepID=UPI001BA6C651|nr:hypothetical protein [Bradyrhizobium sp. JYMT SZCCT0180]MBR1211322.1 hypothetical protein [Bradyrhizobium sp. JYMT SZCCT0180]
MNKLGIIFAVGAAALLGGSAANAADNTAKAKASTVVTQPSTDIGSQRRHHRHYGHRAYRPYYGNSYGYYAPRPYYGGGYGGGPYYGRAYGYGGPSVSFGFGGGPGWY